MLNWNFGYDQPINEVDSKLAYKEPASRGEAHPDPYKVFIDIYGAVKHLTEPGNREFRGRRGIGKTMYFLYAQHKVVENHRNRGDSISSYVDMSDISGFSNGAQISPYFYVNQIYRRIILSVLENVYYPENDKRGSSDLSTLSEEKFVIQRLLIRNKIEKLRKYLNGAGDPLTTKLEFEEKSRIQNALSVKGSATIGAGLDGVMPAFATGFTAEESDGYVYDQKTLGEFEYKSSKIKNLFDEILGAFSAKHLIVFLDEFSTNNIPQRLQPYLVKKLIDTFDGIRFSLKIATIPGATTLSVFHPVYGQIGVQGDSHLKVFDFDDEATRRSDVIRTGNLHVFLKNIAFANPTLFGKYIVDASEGKSQVNAFNEFVKNHFEDQIAFLEFEKSGEGLPRQLFDTFDRTRSRALDKNQKINKLSVWAAAFSDYKQKAQTEISADNEGKTILAKIHSANSRVFKLERISELVDAVERLIAFGFIHACSVSPIYEKEISIFPLEYYYTSYRTEVFFQLSKYVTEPPQSFQVEDMTSVLKSQHKQLYQKAKVVLLKEKKDEKSNKKRN